MKDTEPIILIDSKPDGLEIALRLICGALLGMLLAFSVWIRVAPIGTAWTVGLFAVFVTACAWAAAHYGDHFWHRLSEWVRRFPF